MRKAAEIDDEKVKALAQKFVDDPFVELRFSNIMNLSPLHAPPVHAEDGYFAYNDSNFEGRRKILEEKAAVVLYEKNFELQVFRAHCVNIVRDSGTDPELKGYWKYGSSSPEICGMAYRVLGQRAVHAMGNEVRRVQKKNPKPPKSFEDYASQRAYRPPRRRILLSQNLTFNTLDKLMVFSDLPNETVEDVQIPDSLLYDYSYSNKVYAGREPGLAKAVRMADEPQNLLSCDCCSREPIVPCYENPDCMCYKVNQSLQQFQQSTEKTEFSTFKPILFPKATDTFYECIGFACSDACACRGRCTNNSLLLLEKRLFPFEIYRNDPLVGFSVRSYAMIPAGTPVMEFIGEVTEMCNLNEESRDYAYQITYPSDAELWKHIVNLGEWSKEYKTMLKEFSKKSYLLDPKKFGNVARTCLHSCTPNMEAVRVFQKGLSPAHVRLVLVALEDIFPGCPVSFYSATTFLMHCA
uniref:SET domain-containing protein n=1 Tax=Caenorhabditis japonica TaxID=281687 RepID=A0A8R1HJ52_CAEJA